MKAAVATVATNGAAHLTPRSRRGSSEEKKSSGRTSAENGGDSGHSGDAEEPTDLEAHQALPEGRRSAAGSARPSPAGSARNSFTQSPHPLLRQATHTSDQVKEALLAQQADHKVALHEGVRSTLRDVFKSDRAIDIFKQWDEDGNGTIDKKEFRRAIRQMGLSAENEDLDAVFDSLDVDLSGELDYNEVSMQVRTSPRPLDPLLMPGAVELPKGGVVHKIRAKDPGMRKSKLTGVGIDMGSDKTVQEQLRDILAANRVRVIDLFREWDDDGNGVISKKEFRQGLRAMDIDEELATREDLDALFDSFDEDKGGTIEYNELNKALRRGDKEEEELRRQLHERMQAGAFRPSPSASRGGSPARARPTSLYGGGAPAGSSLSLDLEPQTVWGGVARDATRSPSWRLYQLKQQVYKMLSSKDKGLPMSAGARSPRHLQMHKERIVAPTKPKPKKVVRKAVAVSRMDFVEVELTCCQRITNIWNGFLNGIVDAFNGFLEQDLEVQVVIMIILINVSIKVYGIAEGILVESPYAEGHAPPSPPTMPDWTVRVSDSAMGYALSDPLAYLLFDFGIAIVIGVIVLFWEDIRRWQHERALAAEMAAEKAKREAEGYKSLGGSSKKGKKEGKPRPSKEGDAPSPRSRAAALIDPELGEGAIVHPLKSESDLRAELTRENDRVEELEMKLKVHTTSGSAMGVALGQRLEMHRERQKLLKEALKGMGVKEEEPEENTEAAAPPKASGGGFLSESQANFIAGMVTVLKNSATGFISVFMFFADVASDIAVIVLLWETKNYSWAIQSVFFLVAQFVVVYFRVLPYMRNTFGASSCLTLSFIYLGFPLGLFILDFLMLLEPFGLLAVLPLPAWLKQFVPAYKATRVITEIAIESLPQCILQSYILIVVMAEGGNPNASPNIVAMVESATVMPKSITISTIAILKTWMEIVQQSREAGISVRTKASQLWHVGAGLPLDALKKGSIVEWSCAYELDKAEIPPLLDALIKNTSLTRLNLSESGLEWEAAESSAAPLMEALITSPSALSGLQDLIISKASGFAIPMGELRAGPKRALAALEGMTCFAPGHEAGPWHADLMVCGDVLRTNGNRRVVTDREKEVGEEVMRLLDDAHGGLVAKVVWEQKTKQLMAGGDLRRSHLQSLVGAECLRDVGFTAAELIASGFSLVELRNGRFTVSELRESGVNVADLSATRYSAAELHEGGVSAGELKPLGYEPKVMREGGYSATEVRTAKYALADLKGVYTAKELLSADFPAAEMRRCGFEVGELKSASWGAEALRKGGYTAGEMRAGGFDASQTRAAGYTATDATAAGWSLEELKAASFDASGLRQAKHTATAMREAGFTPNELRAAQYPTRELHQAGFGAEELRKAGTPIAELSAAGATIEEMRASGISAGGLRMENVKLKDMRVGGYTCKEVKAAGFSCKEVKAAGFVKGLSAGYTIAEAVAAKFSCEELHIGGYSADEVLAVGFAPLEMRAVGFDAKALQAAGVTLPKLRAAGVSVSDLRSAGFSCDELRTVGVKANQLHDAGASGAELKEAGFPLTEFCKLCPVGELRECGFSCEELRKVGFKAKDVLSTGATTKELTVGGYSAGELKECGSTAKELKVLQFTCAELKKCGFNAKALVAVGFDSYALKMGGFRARDVKDCGFKGSSVFGLAELKADGFTVPELRFDEGFTLQQMSTCFSVEELRKDGGVKADELLDVGFSLSEMRQGGYEAAELYEAGYGVQDMKKAGYSCVEVREAGFVQGVCEAGYSAKEARAAGYGADLKRAGYEVKELKAAGCTFAEVYAAGFRKMLKEAGYTARDAKNARFAPKLLKPAGFTCTEAKNAGYGKTLKEAGYTVEEARAAGCTCDQIKDAGYANADIHGPVAGICAAGYTIEEAFEAIFSCEQARLAGFTTGFKAVGYSIKEAKVAGFAADELRIGGYSAEDVKIIGFSVVQAKAAGYTAKEAKAAGWTWEQLAEAGYALRPAERMKGMMNDILGKADLSDAGLARMFATIDADGSGKIDAEEMKRAVLKTYGQGVEAGVVEEMMRAADVDNSGEVDLEEFKVILRAGPDYIGPALV